MLRTLYGSVIVSLFVVVISVLGAPSPTTDRLEQARDAYASLQDAQQHLEEADASYKRLVELDEAREATVEARRALNAARSAQKQVLREFAEAFQSSDLNAWNPHEDAELIEQGLLGVMQQTAESDPDTAVRAGEALMATLPGTESAQGLVPLRTLRALARTGDLDLAISRSRDLLRNTTGEGYRALMMVLIGDIECARGDVPFARRMYREVISMGSSAETSSRLDAAIRHASRREAVVDRRAPEIASERWVGGDARALSALRGNVVVVDFWATWCGPCRVIMPELNRLFIDRKDDGLVVLGLTRHYKRGYVPATTEESAKGKYLSDISEEDFDEHLAEFRQAVAVDYPFVIGTRDDFKAYSVTSIPTVVVVDQEGRVVLVTVGSGQEGLVRATVERLLALNSD